MGDIKLALCPQNKKLYSYGVDQYDLKEWTIPKIKLSKDFGRVFQDTSDKEKTFWTMDPNTTKAFICDSETLKQVDLSAMQETDDEKPNEVEFYNTPAICTADGETVFIGFGSNICYYKKGASS